MSDGLATPSPVAYVVPATRIGLPPPTLWSTAGVIQPLVADTHGWWESGWSAPDGGAGATVTVETGEATETAPRIPLKETAAPIEDAPTGVPDGTVTVNRAVAVPPGTITCCCPPSAELVHPAGVVSDTAADWAGVVPSLRTATVTASFEPAAARRSPVGVIAVPFTAVNEGASARTRGLCGSPVPFLTMSTDTPCAGTLERILSFASLSACVQASVMVTRVASTPTAEGVVAMSAGVSPRLTSATAVDPSASGLVQVSVVPAAPTRTACLPSGSRSMARRSGLVSVATVAGVNVRGSLPTTSGAADIDHSAICERNSSSVIPSCGPR